MVGYVNLGETLVYFFGNSDRCFHYRKCVDFVGVDKSMVVRLLYYYFRVVCLVLKIIKTLVLSVLFLLVIVPLGISLLSGLAGGVAAILCMLTGRFNDSVEER